MPLEYFNSRKLTNETIQKFGLGYSPKGWDVLYKELKRFGFADELLSAINNQCPRKDDKCTTTVFVKYIFHLENDFQFLFAQEKKVYKFYTVQNFLFLIKFSAQIHCQNFH